MIKKIMNNFCILLIMGKVHKVIPKKTIEKPGPLHFVFLQLARGSTSFKHLQDP